MLLKKLEIIGVIVLVLVIVAWLRTPEFFEINQVTLVLSLSMICLIVAGLISSVLRIFKLQSYVGMTILGILLIGVSALVYFFYPEYFYVRDFLNLSYWHKVSFVSLPAICFEGGNITLFNVFIEKNSEYRTQREKLIMSVAFVAYVIFAVTANFMFINGQIDIESYVRVYKVTAFFVLLITFYLIYLKKNKSHTIKF